MLIFFNGKVKSLYSYINISKFSGLCCTVILSKTVVVKSSTIRAHIVKRILVENGHDILFNRTGNYETFWIEKFYNYPKHFSVSSPESDPTI